MKSCNKCKHLNKRKKKEDPCSLKLGAVFNKDKYYHPKDCQKKEVKVSHSQLNKKLDELWSLCGRKVGKCFFCGRGAPEVQLNAHHLCTRARQSTRWTLENSICVCYAHHIAGGKGSIHKDGLPQHKKIYDTFGKEFVDKLVEKSEQQVEFSIEDKQRMLGELKEFLESDKQIERKGE